METPCTPDCLTLAAPRTTPNIIVDPKDYPGVIRATKDIQSDLKRVTGTEPKFASATSPSTPVAIIIGTVGKSDLIRRLAASHKIKRLKSSTPSSTTLFAIGRRQYETTPER